MLKITSALLLFILITTGCATSNYSVGSKGPAGGYIFYDDEADGVDNIPDARFLEAAPEDLPCMYTWGGQGDILPDLDGYKLGTGKDATEVIVSYYPDGNFAANACAAYKIGEYDDWFLPSLDALKLMFSELKLKGIGGFTNDSYLTSGEDDPTSVEALLFKDNQYKNDCIRKNILRKVRPIRSFSLEKEETE